jgi:hypothetical protein
VFFLPSEFSEGREILEWLNQNHMEDLKGFCREYASVAQPEIWFAYMIDRLGFNIIALPQNSKQWHDLRLPFPFEVGVLVRCCFVSLTFIRCKISRWLGAVLRRVWKRCVKSRSRKRNLLRLLQLNQHEESLSLRHRAAIPNGRAEVKSFYAYCK